MTRVRGAPVGPRPPCTRFPWALLVGPARVKSGSDMGPPSSHITAKFLIHCSCCCPLFIENELELCTWELIGVCMLVNRTSVEMLEFRVHECFWVALCGRGGAHYSCGFCLFNNRQRLRMAYCSTAGRMSMAGGISCPWLSSGARSSSGNSWKKPLECLILPYNVFSFLYCEQNLYSIYSVNKGTMCIMEPGPVY